MSDYLSLQQCIHLSTNFSSFFCGFWIYPTLHVLGSLWKCNIWIAEFFEFYTFNMDSRNVNNVVCVSTSHAQRPCAFMDNACICEKYLCFIGHYENISWGSRHAFSLSRFAFHVLYSCLLHHSTYIVFLRSVWTSEQASCSIYDVEMTMEVSGSDLISTAATTYFPLP
jgi:hypothetical protein